jgi:hypothetical protein
MPKPDLLTEEQVLRERLRREAAESRPEFSESLHERILSAVRQDHASVAKVHLAAVSRPWLRNVAALAVTAGLLFAAAIGWRLVRPPAPQAPGGEVVNDTRTWIESRQAIDHWADQTTTGLDGLVSFTSAAPRESVLKHDARLVASTLLEPLPVNVPLAGEP